MTSASQTSNSVLLVRPARFGFHAEAAASNAFASAPVGDVQGQALAEFESLARRLAQARVNTFILDDEPEPARTAVTSQVFATNSYDPQSWRNVDW